MAQKQIMDTCDTCHLADAFCKCRRGECRTSRYPNDDKLRAAGFAIYSRPKSGKNIWMRRGHKFDELTAMEVAEQLSARD